MKEIRVNNYVATVYNEGEIVIDTKGSVENMKQYEVNDGRIYLTAVELRELLKLSGEVPDQKADQKIPTVHINGTDKGTLEHYLRLQLDALRQAAKNMRIYGPHERDYYTQEFGAFRKAQDEQDRRIASVDRVIAEVEHILEKVDEQ